MHDHSTFVKVLEAQEEILYYQQSDLNSQKNFSSCYLIITNKRILVWEEKLETSIFHSDVKRIKVEELFSHSRIVAITKKNEFIPLIYYSRVYVPEFLEIVSATNYFFKTKQKREIKKIASLYCEKCNEPLPDRHSNCIKCLGKWAIFLRLIKMLGTYKLQTLSLVLLGIVSVLCQLCPPYMSKLIVDDCIEAKNFSHLNIYILIMLVCGIGLFVFRTTSRGISTWLSARMTADLRSRLHRKILYLPLDYYNKNERGEIFSRIMNDTGQLQQFLVNSLPYFLIHWTSFIATACILFSIDTSLAFIVLIPVPILMIGGRWFWNRLVPLFHSNNIFISATYSTLNESIDGIKIIKAFHIEEERVSKFKADSEKMFRNRCTINYTLAGFQEMMIWLMSLASLAVWFFGVRRIMANDPTITLGSLMAFVGYIWLFYSPLQNLNNTMNSLTRAFAGAERIFSLLDTPLEKEVFTKDEGEQIDIKGAIELKNIHFSYDKGKEVIKNVSLKIEPGEMIGLIGKSGAGKSTLIHLICGFYQIDSGEITIDQLAMDKISLAYLRKNIGFVPQIPFLFNSTIAENIRSAKPDATFAEIVTAAKAAYAHDFILKKERGYDTIIGDKGSKLSGGERQRIAIARAILHDPPILILDEATSAVDSETEYMIQQAIENLVKGRTTIAIAHRLSTLRCAHRLVVVDEGEIVESGSHEDLIKQEGQYAQLIKLQQQMHQLQAQSNYITR